MRGFALVAITAAACSAPEPTDVPLAPTDARPDASSFEIGECWPTDVTAVPRGSVSIGTGEDAFVPIGSEVGLVYGTSGGYFLPLTVRMSGLLPGNVRSLLDPQNPRSRFSAFLADTGQPLGEPRCFRSGYGEGSGGFYELQGGAPLVADLCWRSGDLIGQRVRIELEVIDTFGGRATDVRIVTLAAPPVGTYPIDEGSPGCDAP